MGNVWILYGLRSYWVPNPFLGRREKGTGKQLTRISMDPYVCTHDANHVWIHTLTQPGKQRKNIKIATSNHLLKNIYSNLVDSPTNIHTCQSIPTQQPAFVVKNFQQGILKKQASEHESSPSKTWRTFVLTTSESNKRQVNHNVYS